jgi:hypothetical protein
VLIHQLPPEPPYLRAKIAQRLAKVGALPLKNSVYVLPERPESHEDFEWIAKEAVEGGGQAWIGTIEWLGGTTDRELRAAFRAQADEGKATTIARRDRRALAALRGKVWVTRRGVFVDRIATAWLVRRFIDPRARFRFVAGSRAPARPDEIRFDMTEAEVTHDGGRCTFEVLLDRLGLADAALRRIAEIVHDIDLKEDKFGHPETAGLQRLLAGLAAAEPRDSRRLEQGLAVFDSLFRGLGGRLPRLPEPPRRKP